MNSAFHVNWKMARWPGWTRFCGDYEIHYHRIFGPLFYTKAYLTTRMGEIVKQVPLKEALS